MASLGFQRLLAFLQTGQHLQPIAEIASQLILCSELCLARPQRQPAVRRYESQVRVMPGITSGGSCLGMARPTCVHPGTSTALGLGTAIDEERACRWIHEYGTRHRSGKFQPGRSGIVSDACWPVRIDAVQACGTLRQVRTRRFARFGTERRALGDECSVPLRTVIALKRKARLNSEDR